MQHSISLRRLQPRHCLFILSVYLEIYNVGKKYYTGYFSFETTFLIPNLEEISNSTGGRSQNYFQCVFNHNHSFVKEFHWVNYDVNNATSMARVSVQWYSEVVIWGRDVSFSRLEKSRSCCLGCRMGVYHLFLGLFDQPNFWIVIIRLDIRWVEIQYLMYSSQTGA